MSEERMIEMIETALGEMGIHDHIVAAGEFSPRGHTGSMFIGGLAGSEVGQVFGGVGEAVGLAAGSIAGPELADTESGLPGTMIVGVSETTVYGFGGRRSHLTSELLFHLPRAGLTVEVHQRVNVRVLELVDEASGSRLELEGNRLPMTHSKDVVEILRQR
jgi:hypothetical protein